MYVSAAKGGDPIASNGQAIFKNLDKFFSALGYSGAWSQPTGEGNPHKFTNKLFTCIYFATKKSLLISGKNSNELKDKLKQALANPIPLRATEPTATVNGDNR